MITVEDEEKLWESKTLGDHQPEVLLRTVFYLNGRNLCLRGGQEHRGLKLSQFVREENHWKYIENGSKNFRGGVGDLGRENKVLQQYPCPELGNRCHFQILDTYFSRLPLKVREKDVFYLTPLRVFKEETGNAWFSLVPVGRNKLDGMVKEMCSKAGIAEPKSNHSLHATGATRLFRGGIPEKAIQARTGHKSVEALRTYERVSGTQEKAMCKLLGDISNKVDVPSCSSKKNVVLKTNQGTQHSAFNFSGCSVTIYKAPATVQSSQCQSIQLSQNDTC